MHFRNTGTVPGSRHARPVATGQAILAVALLLSWHGLVSSAGAGETVGVNWWNQEGHIYDSNAQPGTNETWLFQLVIDPDADTEVTNMIAAGYWSIGAEHAQTVTYGSDEDVTFSEQNANWTNYFGYPSVHGASRFDYPAYAGKPFYFRFFNATTTGGTEAGLICSTNSSWVTPVSALGFPYEAALGRTGTQGAVLAGSTDGVHADGWATMPSTFTLGSLFKFR